jgi:hypothetical protein
VSFFLNSLFFVCFFLNHAIPFPFFWAFYDLNVFYFSYKACSQDVECFKIYNASNKFMLIAETMITKVSNIKEIHGNLIAIFSPLIGDSFSKSTVTTVSNCSQALKSNEVKAHRFFANLTEKLFGKLNLTISLFDIPTLVSAITPRRMQEFTNKDLFAFTQCQPGSPYENNSENIMRLTGCLLIWNKPLQKQSRFSCPELSSYELAGTDIS